MAPIKNSTSDGKCKMASYEISDVRALVRRGDRELAQRLLEKIAAQVLPILTKRCFRVRRLQEFFPKNANLLGMNVNRGYTIYIRLRPQHRPTTFLPYEALLETMLHELTHMVHGPHNQAFYKYLDELKEETESLMLRGLVGHEGARFQDAGIGMSIHSESSYIHVRHQNDNRAAVLAAQRRDKYQRLLGGITSQRLGSSSRTTGTTIPSTTTSTAPPTPGDHLTPQQLRQRALDAAERRRHDNQACATANGLANAIEILGIDDSSGDEQETASSSSSSRGQRPQATIISIDVDDDDDEEDDDKDDVVVSIRTPPPSSSIALVDLLDDSDSDDDKSHSNPPPPPPPRPQQLHDSCNAAIVDLTQD